MAGNKDPIKVFAFSNGLNLIAYYDGISADGNVIDVRAPVVLNSIIDPDTSEITGFYTSPFMAPYVEFNIKKTVQLSNFDLFCIDDPTDFLKDKFLEIVDTFKNNSEVPGDASIQVEIPTEPQSQQDPLLVDPPNYAGG